MPPLHENYLEFDPRSAIMGSNPFSLEEDNFVNINLHICNDYGVTQLTTYLTI